MVETHSWAFGNMTGGWTVRRRDPPGKTYEGQATGGSDCARVEITGGCPDRGGSELESGDSIFKVGIPKPLLWLPKPKLVLHMVKPSGTEVLLCRLPPTQHEGVAPSPSPQSEQSLVKASHLHPQKTPSIWKQQVSLGAQGNPGGQCPSPVTREGGHSRGSGRLSTVS